MHSPRRFALAGTLDEYGDIRSRPHREVHTRIPSVETRGMQNNAHQSDGQSLSSPAMDGSAGLFSGHHDFETDMFQWPFIDGSWSAGFDAGLDGLWHNSGLFDSNPSMR